MTNMPSLHLWTPQTSVHFWSYEYTIYNHAKTLKVKHDETLADISPLISTLYVHIACKNASTNEN